MEVDQHNGVNASADPVPVTLHHSATGSVLHLRQCPHLVSAEAVLQAGPDDTRPVCTWSQNEIDGTGRTYHATLEEALADLGAAQHSRAELTRLLNDVDWDQVFVPNSRSYVTVLHGNRPVAWAGKNYVGYPDRPTVQLPDYVGRDADGPRRPEGAWGQSCPECHQQRSVSGACEC